MNKLLRRNKLVNALQCGIEKQLIELATNLWVKFDKKPPNKRDKIHVDLSIDISADVLYDIESNLKKRISFTWK